MADTTGITVNDCTSVSSHHDIFPANLPERICIIGKLQEDFELVASVQKLNLTIIYSGTGSEFINDKEYATYFVLPDFNSAEFEYLLNGNERILGKGAILDMANDGIIKYKGRPHYSNTMKNCIIIFTCFKRKSELSRLIKLIHSMGGSVKRELTDLVTHVVAYQCMGEKYQYAVTFDVPVMGPDWIDASWAHRDEPEVRSDSDSFVKKYKLPLFHNLHILLHGFSEEDTTQMGTLIEKNGGFVSNLEDSNLTHVVLDDQNVTEKPKVKSDKVHVVKAEWFWASVQIDAGANEKTYLFESNSSSVFSPRNRIYYSGTPGSRSRRRKRLRETMQQLAENESPSALGTSLPASKRRSSVSDLAFLSADGSLFEDSIILASPSVHDKTPMSPPIVDLRSLTPRQRVFHELVMTECNYVAILDTITKIIKEPLENPNPAGGPIIDSQDVRYIFGNLPPIHDVHTRLRSHLLHLFHHWVDDSSIGKTILAHTIEFEKAYPPFVNYFENVKELLQKLTAERPRFHAFLKIAQRRPECGRQSFQELLIRPVQRLPSMSLLLADLIKHTDKSNPDHAALEEALEKIKSIMTLINDDKRKTEAKLKLFEIHNDIENCPPNLVASHRTYIKQIEVLELSDSCSNKGDILTLFLFNDVLEICKKKSKYNSLKSPGRANISAMRVIKAHKHLEMLSLTHVKRVVDIRETDECRNVFAIIIRSNREMKEKLYTFSILGAEEGGKVAFLKVICSQMASVMCRSDVENFMVTMESEHLDIDTSDLHLTTSLSKAIRFATRTTRKVSRAFSFNKSPGKLKRAVSTVMSPFANGASQSIRVATSVSSLAHQDMAAPGTPPTAMAAPSSTPTPRRRLTLKRIIS